ncbi:MAG: hypothetical protein M0018_03940 [Nitrospiraceae bacterium]|nr:hypothetical protein [Nitrospiraceae bacterium]
MRYSYSRTDRYRILTCPFCGREPEAPHTLKMNFGEAQGGRCECGAIYVYDETGRSLGDAFMDALALLFDQDYDAALSATEDDYEEETITFDRRLGRFVADSKQMSHASKYLFLRKKEKPA